MKSNSRLMFGVMFLGLCALGLYVYLDKSGQRYDSQMNKIFVVQDKPQEWADALKLGVSAGLREQGLIEGENVIVVSMSATGNPQGLTGLAEAVSKQKADAIYTLGTQATQAVFAAGKERAIVFGAVTDPVKAGLYHDSLNSPNGNITGTQDLWPYGAQFDLIAKLVPSMRNVGIIYNAGEVNSQVSVSHIREECNKRGWSLTERTVTEDSQIQGAVSGLLESSVDAVFIPADNTAQGASQVIIAACIRRKVPVFAGIPGIVENGAVGTVGTNYYELGKVNARQIQKILSGVPARDIPVQTAERGDLYLNARAARENGIALPDDLLRQAVKVYE